MSNHADSLTLRLARPDEHEELEAIQQRAALELPEYRDQLFADPQAIYLPQGQIANGQVIVAEIAGEIVGFAAVVGGELDGLFVEPELWGWGVGKALVDAAVARGAAAGISAHGDRQPARPALLRALRAFSRRRGADPVRPGAEDDEIRQSVTPDLIRGPPAFAAFEEQVDPGSRPG